MHSRMTEWKFWVGWTVAFAAALFLVVLATLPPFLEEQGRALLMQAFAPYCHQLPAYSPHINGVQLAVGHRMYGIFLGLALGTVAFLPLRRWDDTVDRHAKLVLLAAVAPLALDWVLDAVGLWAKTPASRFITGAIFGIAAGYILARAFVHLLTDNPSEKQLTASKSTS